MAVPLRGLEGVPGLPGAPQDDKALPSNVGGTGLIPGGGTKVLHVAQCSQKKKSY